MSKMKTLKLWNMVETLTPAMIAALRLDVDNHHRQVPFSICATTRAHAMRLFLQLDVHVSNTRMRDYASECWGTSQERAVPVPEVGIWCDPDRHGNVYRVVGADGRRLKVAEKV